METYSVTLPRYKAYEYEHRIKFYDRVGISIFISRFQLIKNRKKFTTLQIEWWT
jgi:hypothetical protein